MNQPKRSKHCSHSRIPSSFFSITPARYALKYMLYSSICHGQLIWTDLYLEKYLNLKFGSVTSMIASSIFACFIAHSGYSFESFILQRYFDMTTESAKKPSLNWAHGIWCFGFKVSYHSDRCSPFHESNKGENYRETRTWTVQRVRSVILVGPWNSPSTRPWKKINNLKFIVRIRKLSDSFN